MSTPTELKRILSPAMVWGLGVGYVISGNYFGWNLGLEKGGTLGLAIATGFIILMYITFTYSYAELSCAIPKAGGAFDYARRTHGDDIGFLAGMSQNVEFIFAPPAIAFALGSYLHLFLPTVPVLWFSIASYVAVTLLNVSGVKAAATFELIVTAVAVAGLVIFSGTLLPQADYSNLSRNSLPHGISGIFAAVPFAIWFFLGIEGVANLAEETVNPKRTMSIGFLSTLFTLITLCVFTFISATGVAGWEAVVFLPDGSISDSPLPLAMQQSGGSDWMYQAVIMLGLFGLFASLNGLMLAAGRSTYEFAKVTIGPVGIGKIQPRFQTPANALLLNMVVGIGALFTGRTGEVITISVLGALTLYCFSMLSVMRLRKREPDLERPFLAPFYPWFPVIALVIAAAALIAVAVYNLALFGIYLLILGVCFGIFKFRKMKN